MNAKSIIEEAILLPVEERAAVVDSLLRSLNAPDDEFDRQWISAAQRRLDELRSGAATAIPGDVVFAKA